MPTANKSPRNPLETILVIESDILVRAALSDYLRHCGYKVLEASDTDEALLILNGYERPIDVVLVDAEPKGSLGGFVFASLVRQNRQSVAVLLAASPSATADQARNLCEGASVMEKPYQSEQLHQRVHDLLKRRKQLSSELAGRKTSHSQ